MVAEWLTQTVDVPLWGVFVLTAYSARRLATAVDGLGRLRHRASESTSSDGSRRGTDVARESSA
jgi:hypothetical protein